MVRVEASRLVVGKGRTALDDAKSDASHRTVPVEQMHAGAVALLRSLSASQAADRMAAGTAYDDSGLVVVDALGRGVSPGAYSDRFRALCAEAGVPTIRLHEVRHTLALMLHRAGAAPADAASLRGTRSRRTSRTTCRAPSAVQRAQPVESERCSQRQARERREGGGVVTAAPALCRP
jgi:integrase